LLTVDAENYSALKLTEAARPVLRGEQQVQLRRYRKPEKAKRSSQRSGFVETDLSSEEQALFEKLRWWRVETARRTTSRPMSSSTMPPCAKSPRPGHSRWTTCATSPAWAKEAGNLRRPDHRPDRRMESADA
jgi:hypothetical protein